MKMPRERFSFKWNLSPHTVGEFRLEAFLNLAQRPAKPRTVLRRRLFCLETNHL